MEWIYGFEGTLTLGQRSFVFLMAIYSVCDRQWLSGLCVTDTDTIYTQTECGARSSSEPLLQVPRVNP
jgi:hypothetical protein